MIDYLKKYEKEILWEKPIKEFGLELYPIKMEDAIDFYNNIGILLIQQQDIKDPELASLSYLDLLFHLGIQDSLFHTKFFNLLYMILKIPNKTMMNEKNEEVPNISFIMNNKNKIALKIVTNQINPLTNKINVVEISALKFNALRSLICAQNGITLPDLAENAQILNAIENLNQANNENDSDFMLIVYSVVGVKGYELDNVKNWSLFRFNKIVESIDKDKKYSIYASAEIGGMVTFKNGNPLKSWILSKTKKDNMLKEANSIAKSIGMTPIVK